MIYLDIDDLLHAAERVLGGPAMVRDMGLLEAACARPKASYAGDDLYQSASAKGAALMHSTAKSHALVDGNKRLAIASLIAFLGLNGSELTLTNEGVFDFALSVGSGELDSVEEIAAVIEAHSRRL